MTIELWTSFFLVVLILNVTPGPDMAYILSRTIAQGVPAGIVSAAGVSAGALFHVGFATVIFILATKISELTYTLMLIAGASYLIWLGVSSLIEKPGQLKIVSLSDRKMIKRIFIDGVMVDILNPKVAIFFLALLPGFLPQTAPSSGMWFLSLGILVVALSFLIEIVIVLASQKVKDVFSGGIDRQIIMHRLMGVVFILIGLFALTSINFRGFLQ